MSLTSTSKPATCCVEANNIKQLRVPTFIQNGFVVFIPAVKLARLDLNFQPSL